MDCREYTHHVYNPPDQPGRWWEIAVDPNGRMVWQQEIMGQQWASSTEGVQQKLHSLGICSLSPPASEVAPIIAATTQASTAPLPTGEGAVGLLLFLGLIGSAIWAWFNKGKDDYATDYHPMADVPQLPPVYIDAWMEPEGNQTLVTPSELAPEFTGHSIEFDSTPDPSADELQPDSPPAAGDPPAATWPPRSMGAPYDPIEPEQDGEFDTYRRALEKDGLNPKGNEVLKAVWGVTPGRSRAYQAARKRRDAFAKRLDYYRYED